MADPHHGDRAFVLLMYRALGRELATRYVELREDAEDQFERRCWQERLDELQEQMHQVAVGNGEQLLDCIERWSDVLEDLEALR